VFLKKFLDDQRQQQNQFLDEQQAANERVQRRAQKSAFWAAIAAGAAAVAAGIQAYAAFVQLSSAH
jgi:hypothetical protein